MMKRWLIPLLTVLLLLLCAAASAEPARDITDTTLFNGAPQKCFNDWSYRSYWDSAPRGGIHSIVIEAPEGETIGGLYVKLRSWPIVITVQEETADGWRDVAASSGRFCTELIPVPSLRKVRILGGTNGQTKLQICEMNVLTPGELPPDIQIWREAPEKIDLMLLSTHPDDEVLWFGGLLPYYSGEAKKNVLVVNAVFNNFVRRLELLDCLWACGVDIYPVYLNYLDVNKTIPEIYRDWGGVQKVKKDIVTLYRRYQPDVVVLHDLNGEYGHWAHKTFAQAGQSAAELARDAAQYPDTAEQYGVWDIPKVYIHLYPEKQMRMDWNKPLSAFDGRTGLEVAAEAFTYHISQQGKKYQVVDGGPYDCALFGLWYTAVGDDTAGGDLFENIPLP